MEATVKERYILRRIRVQLSFTLLTTLIRLLLG